MPLAFQLRLVHARRRHDPHARRDDLAHLVQQAAGGAEVADVGHARADEHLVNFVAGDFRQRARVVGVVGRAQNRLGDFVQVNVNHLAVFGVFVGGEEFGRVQPRLHFFNAPRDGARVSVALAEHPFQHDDVGGDVFGDRLAVEFDRAAGSGALRGRVGEFKRLLHLQVGQALNLQNAPGVDVFLAGFFHGEQALLNRRPRKRVHQIAQRDSGLHLAVKTHQHRLRHVQRHHAGCRGERDQARAGRKGNADGKTRVRIAAGADAVGQQHAVHPRMNDAVAGAQRNAGAVHHEIRQTVLGFNVHRFRVGRGVAERLHDQVGGEAEAGEVFEFVAGHRAGGVLRADRAHARLAILVRADAVHAAGAPDDFLREGVAALFAVGFLRRRFAKRLARRKAERLARARGQTAADDQVDAPAGAHFVQQHFGFQFEFGEGFAVGFSFAGVAARDAVIRMHINDIAGFHLGNIHLHRQRARIFQRVEKDRRDLPADAVAAAAFVGNAGDVFAGVPQQRIDRGFSRRAGADHIADIGDRMSALFQFRQSFQRFFHAFARIFQHGERVQRNVRARPRVHGRRQIVGVGFAGDFENGQGDDARNFGRAGEPLGIGP